MKKLVLYRENDQYILRQTDEHGCVTKQSFSTLGELKEVLGFCFFFDLNQCEIITFYDSEIESFLYEFFRGWYVTKRTHWRFTKNLKEMDSITGG